MEKGNKIETIPEEVIKIREYEQKGYYFHGSTDNDIDVLEPRLGQDVNPTEEFNNDEAVFASSNPLVCIFALQKPTGTGTWSFGGKIAELPKEWKKYLEKSENTGTLYVLSPESFIHSKGWQSKSKEKVKPVEKIIVSLNTFFFLGGEIVWRESE